MEPPARLPPSLSRYLVAVAMVGPAVAATVAVIAPFFLATPTLLAAAVLTGLAIIAERHQVWLTHSTHVNVTTAAFMTMILVLPVPFPGLLASFTILAGHLLRRRDRLETIFNVGQWGLGVTIAAVALAAIRDLPLGPAIGGFGGERFGTGDSISLGAIVLVVVLLHLVNTGLVSGASGLQQGVNPFRLWRRSFADDLPAHLVLAGLGVVAAFLTVDYLLVVPLLALPVVLVHRALRAMVRLRTDTQAALAALVDVVELRDPDTAGHSRRVAITARALALRLGLTVEEAEVIASAGHVHDVGKVGIDLAILRKPGRLDEAEWDALRRHPALGADIVGRVGAYGEGHRLVRHHHEAWAGGGYPDGLIGAAIPLGARILAVADAFDALTSNRAYRPGMSVEQAVAVLVDGAGRQWDPAVVTALVAELRALLPAATAIEADRQLAPGLRRPRPAGGVAATAAESTGAVASAVSAAPSLPMSGGNRRGDAPRSALTFPVADHAIDPPDPDRETAVESNPHFPPLSPSANVQESSSLGT